MQQNPRPTRAERHAHLAGGGGDGAQVDLCHMQGLFRDALPMLGRHQTQDAGAPAATVASGFAATVFFEDDRDVQARHRAGVLDQLPVGTQDEHLLQ